MDETTARLDERVNVLQKDVTEIKTNHLPHIYERLGNIELKIAYWTGGAAVLTTLANAVMRHFGK
jgi:hypothetical protein